jgi:hypothetical protein
LTGLTLAFVIAGVWLFIHHIAILQTWRPVEAKVARSDVIEFRDKEQKPMYRGEVELVYSVDGKEYRTPETFSTATSDADSIHRQMETTYAVGTRHQVFFNPANPYSLRWNVGVNFAFFLLPIVFTAVGLILIGVCYLIWRLPFPSPPTCSRCLHRGKPDDRFCSVCGIDLSPPHPNRPDGEADIPIRQEVRREKPAALVVVGLFFAVPGVVCCIAAAWMGMNNFAATQRWPLKEATVTDNAIAVSRPSDGLPVYRLRVAFDYEEQHQAAHASGQSIYVSSSYPWIALRLQSFPVGSRRRIRVNPEDAADIRFDLESTLLNWLPTAGVGLLGFIFASTGISLVWFGLSRRCVVCRHKLARQAEYCSACGQAAVAKMRMDVAR